MNGLRILAVDDDDFIHAMLHGMLEDRKEGALRWPYHSSLSLVDGLDALQSFNPDIVLLDLHFRNQEDTTARTAVASISAFSEKAAVIIMTGYSNPELHDECVANGALDFIDKNTLFNLGTQCPNCHKEISLLQVAISSLKERCYNAARQWSVKHYAKP